MLFLLVVIFVLLNIDQSKNLYYHTATAQTHDLKMGNKFKDALKMMLLKSHILFFDEMINIKDLRRNKTKLEKKNYTTQINIISHQYFIYYIGYVTIKDLIYVKIILLSIK